MKKVTAIILVGLLAIGNWPAPAGADDTDIFTTAGVAPNVLILLDNSGSMRDIPPQGTSYSPSKTYTGPFVTNDVYVRDGRTQCKPDDGKDIGSVNTTTRINNTAKNTLKSSGTTSAKVSGPTLCGGVSATLMLGNYRNYLQTTDPGSKTKMEIARDAVINLVNTTPNVRFGMLNYGSTMNASTEGGTVTFPIADMTSSNKTNLINTVTSVSQTVLNGNGTWTPLGESLQEGAAYYAGGASIYNSGVTYTSPIQVACQKNFVVVVTDGMPTQDRNTRLTSPWGGNFRTGLGNYIGDAFDDVNNPNPQWLAPTPGIDPSFTLSSYNSDNASFMLRDVAKFLFDTDLRSDLTGKQNVITYTVSFGLAHPFLQAVADVGGGLYFSVNNQAELSNALKTALIDIVSRSSSFTSLVVPAVQTSQDNVLYSASFTPTAARPFWKGSLKAYPLDSNGNPPTVADPNTPGKFILDDTKKLWDAEDKMNSPTAPSRNIYTVDASGNRIPFDNNIPATDLNVSAGNEPFLIDYVTQDHGALVDWVLGDIFHSTPVVVGTPPLATSDPGFADFRKGLLNRDRMLLYGANEGMLHATYAGTATFTYNGSTYGPGDEVWAFIPRDQLPRLILSDPDLTASATHQYYVDSTAKVADVFIDAYGEGANRWRTVAVTGLRKGGRSYFALDVTDPTGSLVPNPSAYQYPKPLWSFVETEETGTASIVSGKFTNDINKGWAGDKWKGFALIDSTGKRWLITGNDSNTLTLASSSLPTAGPYLITEAGESWSEPVIGKVKVGGVAKWVAFVGGGYDSTSDPTSTASGDDAYNNQSRIGGGVFIVDLATGSLLAEFTNKRFGGTLAKMVNAVPSSVTAVDTDNDGFIDRLYVGDTEGQMWRISYTGGVAGVDKNDINNWNGQLIFDASAGSARNPGGSRPIFYPPTVAFDPAVPGQMWVFFGTGNQNTPQDTTNTNQGAFFAVTDPGVGSATEQWSLGIGAPDNSFAAGEKVLAGSSVFNSTVFFTTYTPTAVGAVCGGGGTGKLYAVQYTNGYAALDYSNAYAALAPGPNTATRSVSIGTGIPSKPVFSLQTGSGGQKAQFELFISSSGTDLLLDPKAPGAGGNPGGGIPRVPGPGQLKTVRYWREL